jgi:L-ascorbate metabolism protein UlaG (beta-lactamase superfamily)
MGKPSRRRRHRFANLDPLHRFHDGSAIWRWAVWERLNGSRRVRPPGSPAPWLEPDAERIRRPQDRSQLTWGGHSTFLATLAGRSVLIDPVFSRRVGWLVPRHGRPGLSAALLPRLSAVLVSHNHYDHLDRESLCGIPADVPAVVPLGLGRWFARWNRRPVVELEWWQGTEVDGLRITLVPSRHWSRRWVGDINRTLWGGFVIEGDGLSIYHAGDSALFDGFGEIGRRFPGLTAALLPIGAYEPVWFMGQQHMTPEQAGEAFLALGAARLVPMHWGAFQLTDEPIAEPIQRLRRWWDRVGPRDGRSLAELAVGQTVALADAGQVVSAGQGSAAP